jgi:glycolate dehydrogenase FAD-binding subunit
LPSVSSVQEASDCLAAATEEGRKILIGKDLPTNGLNRILEHEAADLTCTVEAGIRLSELNEALALHDQRLSLDPPGDPSIGGMVAENLSGPLRHRFGPPRDLVLGVTLVLADGTIANAGGKVVKNVAGYDLGRLVCGSRGRLALIARVSLRLHPLPRATRTLIVETDDAASGVESLRGSQLEPSALDVLHPGRVAVLFEGSERAVEAQIATARSLVGGAEAPGDVWQEARQRQGVSGGRVRFEPRRLREILSSLDEAVVRPAPGIAYVAAPVPDDTPAGVRRLQEAVRHALDPAGTLAG